MKIVKRYPIILVLVVVLASYLSVFLGFFQQDEWLSFALRTVALEGGVVEVLKDSFAPSVGHFQPLNSLLISTLFYIFRVSYFPYAVISVLLHLVNVFLLYKLAKNFLRDELAGLVIALIFGVTASIYQATSWVLADLAVHLSTLFAILSVSSVVDFLGSNSKSDFTKILIYLVISILFKEISISLFAFIFVILAFSKRLKNKKTYLIKLTIVFALYALLRISMIFIPASYSRDKLVTDSQYAEAVVYNLITLPPRGLVQSILPSRLLVKEAYQVAKFVPKKIIGTAKTPSYDLFVQKWVLEFVDFINLLVIAFLIFFAIKNGKNPTFRNGIIAALAFVLLGGPIFALAPERSGRIFILDSRNLYLLAAGSSFIIYFILHFLFEKKRKIFIFSILVVVLLNIYGLNKELVEISRSGALRKKILNFMYKNYPNLSSKTVFYTESDSSYYGLPEEDKILPFQSGLGQTLLVWYGRGEDFPNEFYSGRFLWGITEQGYKEYWNRGFGYFRDYELLKTTLKEYNLSDNSVISFKWLSKENRIIDTTEEIREKLNDEMVNK